MENQCLYGCSIDTVVVGGFHGLRGPGGTGSKQQTICVRMGHSCFCLHQSVIGYILTQRSDICPAAGGTAGVILQREGMVKGNLLQRSLPVNLQIGLHGIQCHPCGIALIQIVLQLPCGTFGAHGNHYGADEPQSIKAQNGTGSVIGPDCHMITLLHTQSEQSFGMQLCFPQQRGIGVAFILENKRIILRIMHSCFVEQLSDGCFPKLHDIPPTVTNKTRYSFHRFLRIDKY